MDENLKQFKGFISEFQNSLQEWKKIYESDDPIEYPFPGVWNQLNSYLKLIIIRILVPFKFTLVFLIIFFKKFLI